MKKEYLKITPCLVVKKLGLAYNPLKEEIDNLFIYNSTYETIEDPFAGFIKMYCPVKAAYILIEEGFFRECICTNN